MLRWRFQRVETSPAVIQARIDEQTALLHEQVKVLEKIAVALEARKSEA